MYKIGTLCTVPNSMQVFVSFGMVHFPDVRKLSLTFHKNQQMFANNFVEFCRNCGKSQAIAGSQFIFCRKFENISFKEHVEKKG